jgi:hypothetical protein
MLKKFMLPPQKGISKSTAAATAFLQQNPRLFEKYFGATLLQTLVGAMLTSLWTVTAAKIAFDRLVASGALQRTDGKTDRDDAREAVDAAEANLNRAVAKVDARPLTREELELFGSLSQQDLASRYWDNDGYNEFRVRYDRAVREHLFRVPARPHQEAAQASDELELTPAQYHAIPAKELSVKLRDPKFKLSVMKLIAARLV